MGNCCISKDERLDNRESTSDRSSANPKVVYENIVKIQSSFRGYLARKHYYDERLATYNKQVLQNLHKFAATHYKTHSHKLTPYDYHLEADYEDPLFENRIFKPYVQL